MSDSVLTQSGEVPGNTCRAAVWRPGPPAWTSPSTPPRLSGGRSPGHRPTTGSTLTPCSPGHSSRSRTWSSSSPPSPPPPPSGRQGWTRWSCRGSPPPPCLSRRGRRRRSWSWCRCHRLPPGGDTGTRAPASTGGRARLGRVCVGGGAGDTVCL